MVQCKHNRYAVLQQPCACLPRHCRISIVSTEARPLWRNSHCSVGWPSDHFYGQCQCRAALQTHRGARRHRHSVACRAATQPSARPVLAEAKGHILCCPQEGPSWPAEACLLLVVLPGAYLRPSNFERLIEALQVASHQRTEAGLQPISHSLPRPQYCRPALRGACGRGLRPCTRHGRRLTCLRRT
jgi:hypothetical protein